jgi:two-component system nitrogen regulation response regulator NtrX
MAEIRWDIKRSADVYRQILDARLKSWIFTGKIKPGEVVVWRSGFSGWRRPEELEELIPYFRRYERSQLRKLKRKKLKREVLTKKNQIKNILIIDDEKDLCELLSDTLTQRRYNVACVNTKKEALRSIERSLPELVFLDLKLPDGDGMKLISKIKKLNPDTVVNVISAYGSDDAKEKAMELGVNRFIDKPFSEQDILRSIRVS